MKKITKENILLLLAEHRIKYAKIDYFAKAQIIQDIIDDVKDNYDDPKICPCQQQEAELKEIKRVNQAVGNKL